MVEGPQIFDRAAAAANDDHVDARDPGKPTKRDGELVGGLGALDLGG